MNKKFIEFMILSKKTELKMWELKLNQLTTQETKPLAKPFSNPLSKETVEDTFNDKSFYTRKEIRERLPIEVSTSTIIRDLERFKIEFAKKVKNTFRPGKEELQYTREDVIVAFDRYWNFSYKY